MNNFLITNKTNIHYLSNFSGSSGFMLLTKSTKYLFTDFRYIERAKNTIKKGITIIDTTKMWKNEETIKTNWQKIIKKHQIHQLGIEENNITISQFKKFQKISKINKWKIKFSDISEKIEKLREIKTKEEIKLITKSQRINEKVFTEIKKIVQEFQSGKSLQKITEIDLAWKIKELGYKFGSEEVSFDPIIAFDKNSAIPHHLPGKTILKKNSLILIDMGMKFQGYCSDMTRTILPLNPTILQQKIYNIVLKAQLEGIKNIKAGITGKKADTLTRDIIIKEGYGEEYGHAGGHGIGLDIHESPSISENYTQKLQENSIITVEPGIYLIGKFGVRIEDMILIKKSKVQNLTKMKK